MEATDRVRAMLSFVQAADLGSFAAAARAQGISGAAVSKNVAGLELALGVRLFNRSTRSLRLTAEGEAFLEQARDALTALEDALDSVSASRARAAGKVRFSCSVAFGHRHLIPVLPGFRAQWPDVQLEIDFDDRPVDIVREGYDFVIRGGVILDSALVSRRICALRTVLVASPCYLADRGTPRSVADLSQHSCIVVRFLTGKLSPWHFRSQGEVKPVLPAAAMIVSDPLAAMEAALRDMGIAQTGAHHAWEHLRQGRLSILLADCHAPASREMVIQYPHRALQPPRVKVLVDYLLSAFGNDEALHMAPESFAAYVAR